MSLAECPCCAPALAEIELRAETRLKSADGSQCATLKLYDTDGVQIPSEDIVNCRYYKGEEITFVFDEGGPQAGVVCTYRYDYSGDPCGPNFVPVTLNPDCGSGASKTITSYIYDNEVTDAPYDWFSPPVDDPPSITSTITAHDFIGLNGIWKSRQESAVFIFHTPSPTCYLKAWLRVKLQKWKLRPADDFAGSGPKNDAVWCNDFVKDGAAYWSPQNFSAYEWSASGNPCLSDTTKSYLHQDNRIDSRSGTAEWKVPIECDAESWGAGKSVDLVELKFSYVEGYEPPWPSEHAGCNGFPGSNGCLPA